MLDRILQARPAMFYGNSGQPFDSGIPFHNLASGMVLAEGRITDPVAAISLTLPPEFTRFQLSCVGFDFSTHDNALLASAISQDGGATYVIDTDNADTYFTAIMAVIANVAAGTAASHFGGYVDSIAEITDGDWPSDDPYKAQAVIDIYPGGPTQLPNWTVVAAYRNSANDRPILKSSWHGLYVDATVPPSFVRATNFRLQDYVLGTNLISTGQYTLVGMM